MSAEPFKDGELREMREGLRKLTDAGIFDDYNQTLLEHTIGFLTESITARAVKERGNAPSY